MDDIAFEAQILARIDDLDAAAWDACAGTDNPFVSHAFLGALERSGSATAETGWAPQHVVLPDGAGGIRGAMPLYLKGHSQGEYVFDYAWADAYARAGGRYYPKLQACVPFTPATGPRLLTRPGEPGDTADHLVAAALTLARRRGVSSLHVTFAPEDQARRLESHGLLLRTDQQFHWHNRGYGRFDDFLAQLASRKRKQVRKERREALSAGIEIDWLTGADLTEAVWDRFFDFYQDTGMRKWGRPYLSRAFFSMVGEAMGERLVLVMARRDGRYIAGALNAIGADTLYGRYWGATEHHPHLHFEVCYYQAIDFAIDRGLDRVEAGAQGPHKLARGYEPSTTWSAHWLADPGFHEAVEHYLSRERRVISAEAALFAEHLPFRHDADG
ncbi:GNAT family N-acetyltransferase [Rhodothalassium salexigens]|uniref:GNAT family N-acetyltransferase n=1 Tax=Rhodothalassium salexigens TaxID=1086 RepID=UPI0019141350|nr:GNAT family N-acetyltransferase [Rhodothalassium salexigens]MBK5921126.1 GNAT family N-acetyltransferase [Rhodothalassium salexigens]